MSEQFGSTDWDSGVILPESTEASKNNLPFPKPAITNEQKVEALIQECLAEVSLAHKEKYDAAKAELTAAKFLDARMRLSEFIENVELRARQSKSEIDRVKSEVYFEVKDSNSAKKITEATIESGVLKHESVVEIKREHAAAEASLKKWNYIMDVLKDGHYYFKGIAKVKGPWSE